MHEVPVSASSKMKEAECPDRRKADNYQVLPLLGVVTTGMPIRAVEGLEDLIVVPGQILRDSENAFLLRVKGDAMTGEGIMPRDIVIVAPSSLVNDGELVIARFEDEAVLGRIRRTNGAIFIAPSNPAYSPVKFEVEDCGVIGNVIGLIRSFDGAK